MCHNAECEEKSHFYKRVDLRHGYCKKPSLLQGPGKPGLLYLRILSIRTRASEGWEKKKEKPTGTLGSPG